MNNRPVGSAPPPFFWKVPVPEKDYMSENYRRIRQIANQGQKKRNEPLKAAFIPGVTRNEKYAHVPSRVGEFLKTKREASTPTMAAGQKPGPRLRTGSIGSQSKQPVNPRLSKSSTDLRSNTLARQSSSVASLRNFQSQQQPNSNSNQHNYQNNFEGRRRRVSEESSRPQESVYNWHFKDDVASEVPYDGASLSNGFNSSTTIPTKYCHRVEYLPCDGICAEENFVVDETHPESARSGSSARTSRGCNTEETRILEDPLKSFEVNSIPGFCEGAKGNVQTPLPKSRSLFTLQSKGETDVRIRDRDVGVTAGAGDNEWFQSNHLRTNNKDAELGSRLSSMHISSGRGMNTVQQRSENGRIKTGASTTSLKSVKQVNGNGIGRSDVPVTHAPGTVPKYLKQRQEEWRVQEKERKEAELNANVPQGYVLLSEAERMEHLKAFKTNYDTLINDLNRIPIRIDTIRVREHKIQLEQQLTKLEEAMKTFSRSRVWIKVDG